MSTSVICQFEFTFYRINITFLSEQKQIKAKYFSWKIHTTVTSAGVTAAANPVADFAGNALRWHQLRRIPWQQRPTQAFYRALKPITTTTSDQILWTNINATLLSVPTATLNNRFEAKLLSKFTSASLANLSPAVTHTVLPTLSTTASSPPLPTQLTDLLPSQCQKLVPKPAANNGYGFGGCPASLTPVLLSRVGSRVGTLPQPTRTIYQNFCWNLIRSCHPVFQVLHPRRYVVATLVTLKNAISKERVKKRSGKITPGLFKWYMDRNHISSHLPGYQPAAHAAAPIAHSFSKLTPDKSYSHTDTRTSGDHQS